MLTEDKITVYFESVQNFPRIHREVWEFKINHMYDRDQWIDFIDELENDLGYNHISELISSNEEIEFLYENPDEETHLYVNYTFLYVVKDYTKFINEVSKFKAILEYKGFEVKTEDYPKESCMIFVPIYYSIKKGKFKLGIEIDFLINKKYINYYLDIIEEKTLNPFNELLKSGEVYFFQDLDGDFKYIFSFTEEKKHDEFLIEVDSLFKELELIKTEEIDDEINLEWQLCSELAEKRWKEMRERFSLHIESECPIDEEELSEALYFAQESWLFDCDSMSTKDAIIAWKIIQKILKDKKWPEELSM